MSPAGASPSPQARVLLARAHKTPTSRILTLLEDPYRQVRKAAAERLRELTDPALLSSLAQHRFVEARRVASLHPQTPQGLLELLQRAGASPDLSSFTAPQSLSAAELESLFYGGVFARCLAARHPDTPKERREALLRDPSLEVRSIFKTARLAF